MVQKIRLQIVFVLGVGMFLVLFSRLYQIQVINHAQYARLKKSQCFFTERIIPVRGNIYDRRGRALALSMDVDSVCAFPQEVKNPGIASVLLAPLLGRAKTEIEKKLTQADKKFVWLKRKIALATPEKIRELNLPGIELITEEKRFYPGRELASHVLGMVGVDNQGLSGIEYYFDRIVNQNPGWVKRRKDSLSRHILPLGGGILSPERASIFLTIDKTIQYIVEEELEKVFLQSRAKSGMAIVQNPHTGEILAMACRPTFNPNIYEGVTPGQLKNPAVGDIFEPGSTFKVVTLAASLEEGVARSEDKLFCEQGLWKIAGEWVHDHKPYGWLTVTRIIEESSNIGVAKLARKLGKYKLYQYARNFGFGNLSGLEFPGETPGILRKPAQWTTGSLERIAFGQEVGVTGVQLISAFSAVANQGKLLEPRLIREIRNEKNEQVQVFPARVVRQVICPDTVDAMVEILKGVVIRGTGKLAQVDGFSVAGKTGTAEKINPETRRYYKDKHIASFVGFLPAEDPVVSILVVIDEPEERYYGGEVAAPVFARIGARVMKYLRIPPESILASLP